MTVMDSDAIRKLLDEATPGPWRLYEDKCEEDEYRARIAGGIFILADLNGPNYAHQAPNARLIAAAPDLAAEVLRLRDRLIAEEEVKIRLAYIAAEEIGKLEGAL